MSEPTPIDYERELRAAVDTANERLTVPAEWEGFPGIAFGGFLAGAVLVAAAGRTGQARPLSIFSRFHRPVSLGKALGLDVVHERRGRNVEILGARVSDDEDRVLASFSMAFGRDVEGPLAAQSLPPMPALVRPRPVWEHLVSNGEEPSPLMRRTGFRGESEDATLRRPDDWHIGVEWPASPCENPAVQAAVALMAIDSFVGPATMHANGRDLDGEWPVMMPSLDLNGWFYEPEKGSAAGDWLSVRTSVPVSAAGYAVGRTQVWAGEVLVAEGMSQVALLPVPSREAVVE